MRVLVLDSCCDSDCDDRGDRDVAGHDCRLSCDLGYVSNSSFGCVRPDDGGLPDCEGVRHLHVEEVDCVVRLRLLLRAAQDYCCVHAPKQANRALGLGCGFYVVTHARWQEQHGEVCCAARVLLLLCCAARVLQLCCAAQVWQHAEKLVQVRYCERPLGQLQLQLGHAMTAWYHDQLLQLSLSCQPTLGWLRAGVYVADPPWRPSPCAVQHACWCDSAHCSQQSPRTALGTHRSQSQGACRDGPSPCRRG
jgi:hypothetical protein